MYIQLFDIPRENAKKEEVRRPASLFAAHDCAKDALAQLSPQSRKKMESKLKKAAKKAEADKGTCTHTNCRTFHVQQVPLQQRRTTKRGLLSRWMKRKDRRSCSTRRSWRRLVRAHPASASQQSQTTTPLDDAVKFLKQLQAYASGNIHVHLAAFEIYQRKGKLLLQLQSIKRARDVDVRAFSSQPANDALPQSQNAQLHRNIVKFLHALAAAQSTLNPVVAAVLNSGVHGQIRSRVSLNRRRDGGAAGRKNLGGGVQPQVDCRAPRCCSH